MSRRPRLARPRSGDGRRRRRAARLARFEARSPIRRAPRYPARPSRRGPAPRPARGRTTRASGLSRSLPAGAYRVTVSQPGFARFEREGVKRRRRADGDRRRRARARAGPRDGGRPREPRRRRARRRPRPRGRAPRRAARRPRRDARRAGRARRRRARPRSARPRRRVRGRPRAAEGGDPHGPPQREPVLGRVRVPRPGAGRDLHETRRRRRRPRLGAGAARREGARRSRPVRVRGDARLPSARRQRGDGRTARARPRVVLPRPRALRCGRGTPRERARARSRARARLAQRERSWPPHDPDDGEPAARRAGSGPTRSPRATPTRRPRTMAPASAASRSPRARSRARAASTCCRPATPSRSGASPTSCARSGRGNGPGRSRRASGRASSCRTRSRRAAPTPAPRGARTTASSSTTSSRGPSGAHGLRAGVRLRRGALRDESRVGWNGTVTFGGGVGPALDAGGRAVLDEAGRSVLVPLTSLERYRRTLALSALGLSPAEVRALGGGASLLEVAGGEALASVGQWDLAGFVQDEWRLRDDVTVGLGLRAEAQPDLGGGVDAAPRASFSWTPGRRGAAAPATVVRGGVGLFYERVGESLFLDARRLDGASPRRFAISDPAVLDLVALDAAGNVSSIPAFSGLATSGEGLVTRRIAAGTRAPATLAASLSLDRSVSARRHAERAVVAHDHVAGAALARRRARRRERAGRVPVRVDRPRAPGPGDARRDALRPPAEPLGPLLPVLRVRRHGRPGPLPRVLGGPAAPTGAARRATSGTGSSSPAASACRSTSGSAPSSSRRAACPTT